MSAIRIAESVDSKLGSEWKVGAVMTALKMENPHLYGHGCIMIFGVENINTFIFCNLYKSYLEEHQVPVYGFIKDLKHLTDNQKEAIKFDVPLDEIHLLEYGYYPNATKQIKSFDLKQYHPALIIFDGLIDVFEVKECFHFLNYMRLGSVIYFRNYEGEFSGQRVSFERFLDTHPNYKFLRFFKNSGKDAAFMLVEKNGHKL